MGDQSNTGTSVPDGQSGHERAYQIYRIDQLQQAQLVTDQGARLRGMAPLRIARAKHAIANYQPKPGEDASMARFRAVARMLDERAFYPAHDKRTESPDYHAMHVQMTVTDDLPCLVCGVRHSTLDDVQKNPFGAIQMETHHHVIEWALANAIDAAKFNARVRADLLRTARRRTEDPGYATKHPLYKTFDAAYEDEMDAETIHQWIDHAADNLWVLCDVHHRHKFVGIHTLTYPIWGPQDLVDGDLTAVEIGLALGAP